jgi:peptidyl-prolyl cis-trans isomerase C
LPSSTARPSRPRAPTPSSSRWWPRARAPTPQLREAIKKDLIAREVMMQEAIKQGYDKNPEVKQALENARQTIVVNALARDYITKHPVTDADIKAEYDRFTKQTGDKEYHVRHILVENEADANAIIAKLKGGAKFEDLAKQSKDTGTANNGGDLDWATPSSFPPEFAAGFTSLQKGQVTDKPVKTQVGYHVIKLDDTRAAKLPTLDEVKPQIADACPSRNWLPTRKKWSRKPRCSKMQHHRRSPAAGSRRLATFRELDRIE